MPENTELVEGADSVAEEPIREFKSVTLDPARVAARAEREREAAAFTAEERAKKLLRERSKQRARLHGYLTIFPAS